MGEVAEMILDGVLCEICCALMDDVINGGNEYLENPPGYPRKCKDCQNDLLEE